MKVTWKNVWHVGSASSAFILLGWGVFLFLLGGMLGWVEFWHPGSSIDEATRHYLFGICFLVPFFAVRLLSWLTSEWKVPEIAFSCMLHTFVVEYTFFGREAFIGWGLLYSFVLLAFSFMSAFAGLPSPEESRPLNVS